MIKDPPHSDEAELAVLGSIFLRNGAFDQIAGMIFEHDFYRTAHRIVFTAMQELHEKKKPIDAITLPEELTAAGHFEDVGGLDFILKLGDAVSTSAAIRHQTEIVVEKSLRRRLIAEANGILDKAYGLNGDSQEIVNEALQSLSDIQAYSLAYEPETAKQITVRALERARAAANSQRTHPVGIDCGLPVLDKFLHGFVRSRLYLIGARPGVGKTAAGIQLIDGISRRTHENCLVFSVEMSGRDLIDRYFAGLAGFSTYEVFFRGVPELDLRLLETTSEEFGSRIFIDDRTNTIENMMKIAKTMKYRKGSLAAVMIDYAQIIWTRKRVNSERERVSWVAAFAARIAKELNCIVIMLAQLNRDVEKRNAQVPHLRDFKESGALEENAATAILLHRPDMGKQDCVNENCFWIIDKNRFGKIGKVNLTFNGPMTRFFDFSQSESDREY